MPYVPPGEDVLRIPNPEAGFHFRWLADDPERLSGHLTAHGDRPGYALARKQTYEKTVEYAKTLGLTSAHVTKNPVAIRYGRLILGKIPMAEAQRRIAEKQEDMADRRRSLTEEFVDKNTRRGVRAFVQEYEEALDRRMFALRESNDRISMGGKAVPKPAADDS